MPALDIRRILAEAALPGGKWQASLFKNFSFCHGPTRFIGLAVPDPISHFYGRDKLEPFQLRGEFHRLPQGFRPILRQQVPATIP